ncbi:MAG TPA: CBS domain-containing protein [Gammaproteobacteria bacterium]|nr:CBS domain-containing protein [Gammaproteobacteria bacterium]
MYAFLRYHVGDVMTRNPVTVTPDTDLATLQGLFEKHRFNAVPVSGDGRQLDGLASKYDLLRAFAFTPERMVPSYEEIMATPVARVMTTTPTTVSPDTPVTRILELLVEARHKSFPVLEAGLIVGMVAREDVLEALTRARQTAE